MKRLPSERRVSARSRYGITIGSIVLAVVSIMSLVTGLNVMYQRLALNDAESADMVPLSGTIVYGPTVFDIPTGTSATHVEQFQITYQPGARYRVSIDNGQGGTLEVDSAALVLNGTEILSSNQPLPGGLTTIDVFGLTATNDFVLDLWGATNTKVTLTVETLDLPTTTIFGPEEIIRTQGGPTQENHAFDLPADVRPPYALHLNNGYPDSTNLATVASVTLNGVEIFNSDDLSTSTYYLEVGVSLLDSANALDLSIGSTAGKRYEVYITGVVNDTTPPVVTISSPVDEFTTSDDSVTVTGTVVDQYPVTVDVNGAAAQVVDDTLFSATIPLPSEGTNAVNVTATDASENEGMAAISVVRDQTAPVLTVSAPIDELVTGTSPTPLVGSATDANGADVNVNGIPVPTDSLGAFSDSVALNEGANVLTVTATDPGGNQVVEVRDVTLDTGSPLLTVSTPCQGTPSFTQLGDTHFYAPGPSSCFSLTSRASGVGSGLLEQPVDLAQPVAAAVDV